MKTQCDTLIVGAGLAGLTAARELIASGRDVIVVERAQGVGGRMATERIGGAVYDLGAQFISVRSPEFRRMVDEWVDAGVARLWSRGFADGLAGDGSLLTATASGAGAAHTPARDGHPRYRGTEGMAGIARHLAVGLDVRLGVTVASARPAREGEWVVDADAGRRYRAAEVVLTPPAPQTLAILAQCEMEPDTRRTLTQMQYAPCIAMIARSAVPVPLPQPGVLRRPANGVEWIADNEAKGISAAGPALTVHCDPTFSRDNYDADDALLAQRIVELLRPIVPVDFERCQITRWRYSRPIDPLSAGAVSDGMPRGIVLAGDAYAGARVEGAARSGLAAARILVSGSPGDVRD